MSRAATDFALGELTHQRAHKDALLGWRDCRFIKTPRNGCRNAWEKVML
jgi:hypothetical protein